MKAKVVLAGAPILIAALVAGSVWAQSGGNYHLTWSSIDSGSAVSGSGSFVLRGTIGQPDGGNLSGSYTVAGGFWGQPVVLSSVVSPPSAAPVENYFIIRQVTLTWNAVTGATA